MNAEDVKKVAAWACGRDTGLSSLNLARAAMGEKVNPTEYPSDGGDLGRCLRLIEAVPAARVGVDVLAKVSGPWKRLASRWDELAAMHDADDKQLYREMQKLINPHDLRSYSWTADESGLWDLNADYDAGSNRTVVIAGGSIRFGD